MDRNNEKSLIRETPLINSLRAFRDAERRGSEREIRWWKNVLGEVVHSRALTVCRRRVRDPESAAELAQVVTMTFWRKRDTFRVESEGELCNWIKAVAGRKCIDFLRRNSLAQGEYVALEDLHGDCAACDSSPERDGERAGRAMAFWHAADHARALARERSPDDLAVASRARGVPAQVVGLERNFRALALSAEGQSAQEIGTELGLGQAAVYQAVHRGKLALAFGAERALRLDSQLDLWTRPALMKLAERA